MTEQTNPTMRAQEWAALGVLSLLWGGSFFFAKVAVSELPPLVVVLARVALAAALLVPVLRIARLRLPRDGRTWRSLFIMGLLNNAIPFALFFWAQTQIPSGLAAILTGPRRCSAWWSRNWSASRPGTDDARPIRRRRRRAHRCCRDDRPGVSGRDWIGM